ncbi:PP2C family protein-serine/threonine phosphatase [Corynebacterium ulceribovis]|uniref:PP2C family protein-serine/threonine phosphatase n=1 Tax=Corynebacterium ulceribovis TaxID=487732 RepID=UPI0003611C85|nr:protein phosphatase 2C domain-containing protein [Corynebacterium ulceribovis]
MTLALVSIAASDRGLVRENNEDCAFAGQHVLALADGMGGHAAGEVASRLIIESVMVLEDIAPTEDDAQALYDAMLEGNRQIAGEISTNPTTKGMGTTLTSVLFDGHGLTLLHVGDSRGYLLRDGELTQITRDDTFVQSLVDEGRLTADEASVHPQKSYILKALTGDPVEPTIQQLNIFEGDRLLLCSDGLSDPVSFDTIQTCLGLGSPKEAARKLIEMALRSGGPDNVTMVVADVVAADSPEFAAVRDRKPMMAGAIDTAPQDSPRPDSSAARAAAFAEAARAARAAKAKEAAAEDDEEPVTGAHPTDDSSPTPAAPAADDAATAEKARRLRGRTQCTSRSGVILVALLVAAIVLGLVAAGIWVWQKKNDSYFVAEHNGEIYVYQGLKSSVFGMDLNSEYQRTCLDADGNLTVLEIGQADAADQPCNPFKVADLRPSARSLVPGLAEGSYDDAQQQLKELVAEALPVCVQRTSDKPGGDKPEADKPEADNKKGEPKDSGTSTPPDESDLVKPGENCREVTQ